jgi:hypothetical protein
VSDLEERYRRLLAWLPWEHRRRYEDEMLGVLLDGAREGQRRPSLADTADLLAAAATLRLHGTARKLGDPRWAEAAAAAGALAVIAMFAVGLRRFAAFVLAHPDSPPPLSLHDIFRVLIWAAVVVAAFAGWRWTAVVGAIAGTAAELAIFGDANGGDPTFAAAPVAGGLFAAAAMAAAAIRSSWAGLGRRVLVRCAAAAVVIAVSARGPEYAMVGDRFVNVRAGAGLLVAIALAVTAVWALDPPVRRRAFAILAVPAALVVAFDVDPYAGNAALGFGLVLAPAVAFAAGAALVHRREERLRLLDLGRRADRAAI